MFRKLAVLMLLLVPTALHAATFVVRTDDNLIATADAIVIGRVLDASAQRSAIGIETVTRIAVDRRSKGETPGVVTVAEPGGRIGNESSWFHGSPRFVRGERVMLFLVKTGENRWSTLDFIVGKFDYAVDEAGEEVLVREEAELEGFALDGSPHAEPRRNAARFLSYVERKARGDRTLRPDYLTERRPLAKPPVYELPANGVTTEGVTTDRIESQAINFPPSTYLSSCGTGSGCRWNVFPAAVSWYNQNTLANAPEGGIAAVRTSFNNWNGDCASNINYQYVGANPAATGGLSSADGVNSIRFEANLTQYGAPAYSCSSGGTVGFGGISSASGTHTHLNETFVTVREGDVLINQGLASCPSFTTSERFVSGVAHEFGHTLGFRHSNQDKSGAGACPANYDCSTTALMNSSLVRGLNGALQQWDRNAAEAVYTGNTCTTPPPPTTRVRYDFNGDGKADILWRNAQTGQNWLYLMNANTILQSVGINTEGNLNWQIAGIGDFNGDGKADIFWRNMQTGHNFIYFMNGNVILSSSYTQGESNLNWKVVGIGDLNGDRRDDIVWRNAQTGQNFVYLMNGATVTGALINTEGNLNWQIAAVADFNVDGKADILWRNYQTGLNFMYFMNGATIIGSGTVQGESNLAWQIAGVGDFNGDGSADIFWRNSQTGQNWLYLMNGNTVAYSLGINREGNLAWTVANVADYSGDGKVDILWRNTQTGQNWMYIMNANVIAASVGVNAEGNQQWRVVR